jgi:DNA excision repair protein ERCC-5
MRPNPKQQPPNQPTYSPPIRRRRQTLAIDVSIWLTQFIKAMRDDEGKVVKNAHLIGTFRRIVKVCPSVCLVCALRNVCWTDDRLGLYESPTLSLPSSTHAQLLFYRIKPVFVFDGGAPALKKRTLISRRRRREDQETSLRKTAQRLLLAQLKKHHLQHQQQGKGAKKGKALTAAELEEALAVGAMREGEGEEGGGGGKEKKGRGGRRRQQAQQEEQPGGGFVAGFDPGGQQTQRSPAAGAATAAAAAAAASAGESDEEGSVALMEGPPSGARGGGRRRDPAAAFAQALSENEDDEDDVEWEVDDEEEGAEEEILLESDEVDVGVLAALPPELQKDVVESAKRRQRMQSRQTYMPVR